MDFHRLMVERRPKLTDIREGMFGRMFPDLPLLQVAPEEVLAIGAEKYLIISLKKGDKS